MFYRILTNCGRGNFIKLMSCIVIAAFALTINGCMTTGTDTINPGQLPAETDYQIIKVVMKSGLVINLSGKNALYFHEYEGHRNVIVYPPGHVIELKDALQVIVKKEEINAPLTILAVIGVIAALLAIGVAIYALTKESCPFVYSYDGGKFRFDAEPYGGAITEGMKKTDYSRLEYLEPADGEYRLLIRNEADETQHTDEMKLLVMDTDFNTEIVPDKNGEMTAFRNLILPVSAVDENGLDITPFIREKDDIKWQTNFPADTFVTGKNLRHELTFRFPKPPNAKTVKLITNAGTAVWGGYMIKNFLKLRGSKINDWYRNIDSKGPELKKLYEFIDREELYSLKANVLEGSKWVKSGVIPAGGPFIFENRVTELNIENVMGDTLMIKLAPPYGFWEIDKISVTYDEDALPEIMEIPVKRAVNENGADITYLLTKTDSMYYDMPELTSRSDLYFDVPRQKEGTKRIIYLETTGYYDIHLKNDEPEQAKLIDRIWNVPGYAVEYSMRLYYQYINSLGYTAK